MYVDILSYVKFALHEYPNTNMDLKTLMADSDSNCS
jgi:hypothetical protein